MRYRAILLALLVGGLAAGTGAARAGHLGLDDAGTGRSAISATALALGDLREPLFLAAVARTRDALGRDAERRIDAYAVLLAVSLLVAAAWWTAAHLQIRRFPARALVNARPRAPPARSVLVVSS